MMNLLRDLSQDELNKLHQAIIEETNRRSRKHDEEFMDALDALHEHNIPFWIRFADSGNEWLIGPDDEFFF